MHMNANKMEYMCFNQGTICILNGGSWKLMDKFTYLDSSISSTESNVNISQRCELPKIIWKSNRFDKLGILSSSGCVNTIVWRHHIDTEKMYKEKK